jgi:hypothetical protein
LEMRRLFLCAFGWLPVRRGLVHVDSDDVSVTMKICVRWPLRSPVPIYVETNVAAKLKTFPAINAAKLQHTRGSMP